MSDTITLPRELLLRKELRGGLLDVLMHLLACDTCWTAHALYEHGFNRTSAAASLKELAKLGYYRRSEVLTDDDTLVTVALATTPGAYGPPVCLSRVFFVVQDDLIMVGTSIMLPSRLRQLEEEHGPLTLVADIQGGWGLETRFCERFARYYLGDRWFEDCKPIRDFIAEVSA